MRQPCGWSDEKGIHLVRDCQYNRERNGELEEPECVATAEFREVDELFPKVQKRYDDALGHVTALNRERRDLERREEEALAELEALKRSGPE